MGCLPRVFLPFLWFRCVTVTVTVHVVVAAIPVPANVLAVVRAVHATVAALVPVCAIGNI